MIKGACGKIFIVLSIFCCIFLCMETYAWVSGRDSTKIYGSEEKFSEEYKETEGLYVYSGRRYIRIYIDDKHYAVIDLVVILTLLILFFFVIIMRGK